MQSLKKANKKFHFIFGIKNLYETTFIAIRETKIFKF